MVLNLKMSCSQNRTHLKRKALGANSKQTSTKVLSRFCSCNMISQTSEHFEKKIEKVLSEEDSHQS